jgi:uncharacterized RDD family membrane protein YckC
LSQAPKVTIKSKKSVEVTELPKVAPAEDRKVVPIVDPNWRAPEVRIFNQLSAAEKLELNSLFKEAEAELPATEDEISLGAEQLLAVHNRDDIRVVFDIADEAFENPDIERLLEAGLTGSDGVRADGIELASALKKAQREMDAPFTLAAMSRARQSDSLGDGTLFKKTRRVVAADFVRIFAAGAIDQVGVLALASLVITLLWPEVVGNFSELPDFALIALATTMLFLAMLLQIGYWLLSYLVAGRTPGEFLMGLRIVSKQGSEPTRNLLLVRALAAPLGRIWQMFSHSEPLHSRVSATILTRNRRLGRAING